jgi:hypothetical protein
MRDQSDGAPRRPAFEVPMRRILPDNDDRQFALNVMHWLSRLL